jgi:hypothetical protein
MERRRVTDTTQRNITAPRPALLQPGADRVYDRRSLTYANSFPNAWVRGAIKTIEWLTGKIWVLRRVRQFEQLGEVTGQDFWAATMKVMGIDLQTPQAQLDRIPDRGAGGSGGQSPPRPGGRDDPGRHDRAAQAGLPHPDPRASDRPGRKCRQLHDPRAVSA